MRTTWICSTMSNFSLSLVVVIFLFRMNPSNILCWNVCGLNSRARQDSVRTLVTSARIDIVCLQETKMAGVSRSTLLSMLGSDFYSVELPSVGASGGVLVAWRHYSSSGGNPCG